ncbi:MAG: PH domain-containing protein [Nitrososphaerales archaeon]|jgi:membrane protein YdbS with pleckstrin-like domain
MAQESDVLWKSRPWIRPIVVFRTVALVLVAVLAFVFLSIPGQLTYPILSVPLYLWVSGLVALAWLLSLVPLLVRRASLRYVLRRGSLEVVKGIVGRKTLIVSPSGFSELEVDQGIMGRILNYGSLEVRSQGGQQLNLELIRNPREVSAKIRDVMTTPTVRIATDQPVPPLSKDKK